MKITPDIAELMGTYIEGGHLTQEEYQIVHTAMNSNLDITPIDNYTNDVVIDEVCLPNEIGPELLTGTIAMHTLDDICTNHNYMSHNNYDSIIGDVTPFPGSTGFDVQQTMNDTCAIKSQQIVLHSFGKDIPESSLTIEATEKGYYIPGMGSDPEHIGDLLEDHGVDVHTKHHATVYDLTSELAQGHKVIVGVDADELWHGAFWNDYFHGEQANHALIVTGIDTTDPNDIRVIITDPGTGDVARSYPMSQFIDAWHDSDCMLVATDDAPQVSYGDVMTNPEMINFDYVSGHISEVGNIPYDVFANNMLPQFDDYFAHQMDIAHTSFDIDNMFDNMENVFNHYDDRFANADSLLDMDDMDIDDMF